MNSYKYKFLTTFSLEPRRLANVVINLTKE